jgi:hypothetical protein
MYTVILYKNHLYIFIPAATLFVTELISSSLFYVIIQIDIVRVRATAGGAHPLPLGINILNHLLNKIGFSAVLSIAMSFYKTHWRSTPSKSVHRRVKGLCDHFLKEEKS